MIRIDSYDNRTTGVGRQLPSSSPSARRLAGTWLLPVEWNGKLAERAARLWADPHRYLTGFVRGVLAGLLDPVQERGPDEDPDVVQLLEGVRLPGAGHVLSGEPSLEDRASPPEVDPGMPPFLVLYLGTVARCVDIRLAGPKEVVNSDADLRDNPAAGEEFDHRIPLGRQDNCLARNGRDVPLRDRLDPLWGLADSGDSIPSIIFTPVP